MLSFIKNITDSNVENPIEKENKNNDKENDKENDVKLLNQGTYGCIFRPGIECSGKHLTSNSYITKIQKHRQISNNEVLIGKKIHKFQSFDPSTLPTSLKNCTVEELIIIFKNELDSKRLKL